MPDQRPIAKFADAVATRRVLGSADAAAVLTEIERAGVERVARIPVHTELLPNGIALEGKRGARSTDDAYRPMVLFCARLHPRKRVLAFAEMARILISSGTTAKFVVAGPNEGDLPALRVFLESNEIADRVEYRGALRPDQVRGVLAESDVYVLPSEREPFPMTLLEAMAQGTPAVITAGCMIAPKLEAAGGGPIITDGTPSQLAVAVEKLLTDHDEAERVSRRSRAMISTDFSIAAVVDQLERIYASASD